MEVSQHLRLMIGSGGREVAARRIACVRWNDRATGVMRHADAGYEDALACARQHGLRLPAILD